MAKNEQIAFDQSVPQWFRILNIEHTEFERSRYAGEAHGEGKFRLKNVDLLKEMDPAEYKAAVESVKEFNSQLADTKASKRDYKLGRLLCSIPATYMALNPELGTDEKALDRFLESHPELKTKG